MYVVISAHKYTHRVGLRVCVAQWVFVIGISVTLGKPLLASLGSAWGAFFLLHRLEQYPMNACCAYITYVRIVLGWVRDDVNMTSSLCCVSGREREIESLL